MNFKQMLTSWRDNLLGAYKNPGASAPKAFGAPPTSNPREDSKVWPGPSKVSYTQNGQSVGRAPSNPNNPFAQQMTQMAAQAQAQQHQQQMRQAQQRVQDPAKKTYSNTPFWEGLLYGSGGRAKRRDQEAFNAQTLADQTAKQQERNTLWNAEHKRTTAANPMSPATSWEKLIFGEGTKQGVHDRSNQRKTTEVVKENQGRRDFSAGLESSGFGFGAPQTKALTWAEYDALSSRQRAAVDANTALVRAIRADEGARTRGGLRLPSSQAPREASYDADVERLFGKSGGSDLYAPATVKALAQLNLVDTEKGDLDNYLNMSALVNTDDLARLDTQRTPQRPWFKPSTAGTVGPVSAESARDQQTRMFSDKALSAMQNTLSQGQTLLGSFSSTPNLKKEEGLNALFEMAAAKDFLEPGQWETLAVPGVQEEYGVTTDEIANYFDNRVKDFELRRETDPKARLGLDVSPNVQYLDPDQFRNLYLNGAQ